MFDVFQFEIAPEEGTEQVLRGSTPNECHLQLILTINAAMYVSNMFYFSPLEHYTTFYFFLFFFMLALLRLYS